MAVVAIAPAAILALGFALGGRFRFGLRFGFAGVSDLVAKLGRGGS